MKKLLFMSLLGGLAMLAGCSNDDEWSGPDGVSGNYTLKVQIENNADSRTTVNEENQVVWVENDKIGVYGDQGTVNAAFTFQGTTEDGALANFKGNLKEEEFPTAAYYPYSATAALSGEELALYLPEAYDYTENSNAPMIGVKQEDGSFQFNHLCGLLRISVVGMPQGSTTLKIKSEGTDAPAIAGNVVVQDIHQSDAILTMAADQAKEITISHEGESVSSKVFLIPLPVATYPQLTVSLQSEDQVYFEKHISDCSIKRATLLDMPEISLLPDAEFAVDKENGEMVLFDYKNNAIASYVLKENGLPESIRIWNAEDGQEEGNWSEISFYEDGTIKSIMYDANHIMVFSNYREDLVDMAYYVDGNITVYKEVPCDDIDWDEYKKNIANGMVLTKGFVDDLDQFVNGLKKFATEYAEEVALASSSLTCASSTLAAASTGVGVPLAIYNCGGAIKDWAIYLGKKFDPEHAEEWELIEDLDDCFSLLKSKKSLIKSLGKFDSFADLLKNKSNWFKDEYDHVRDIWEQALEKLEWEQVKVTTGDVTEIMETSAKLAGYVTGWDEAWDGTVGFYFSDTNTNPSRGGGSVEELSVDANRFLGENGVISIIGSLVTLTPHTTYYYRVFIQNDQTGDVVLGDVKSFTTQSVDLRVQTGGVSDITTNSAIVHGTVTNCPPFQINIGFHFYYESTESHKISAKFESEYDLQTRKMTYLGRMSNLTPGTTYKYYAYASVVGMSETYCEGSWKQFTTKGQNPDTKSSVENVIQDHSMEFICKDYVRQIEWNQIQKSEY